jgi:hypothetical protein
MISAFSAQPHSSLTRRGARSFKHVDRPVIGGHEKLGLAIAVEIGQSGSGGIIRDDNTTFVRRDRRERTIAVTGQQKSNSAVGTPRFHLGTEKVLSEKQV